MKDGRKKILEAAYALLCELQDPNKVTVRDISKRAGVGTGLINYYFKSKDVMLMEALGIALAEVAEKWQNEASDIEKDPYMQLRTMLLQLVEIGAKQMYLIKIAARFELTEGDINTPRFILPYVRRITGLDETKSKMLAFSLICNLQSASLRSDMFREFMGLDMEKQADRGKYIDWLLESHLCMKG